MVTRRQPFGIVELGRQGGTVSMTIVRNTLCEATVKKERRGREVWAKAHCYSVYAKVNGPLRPLLSREMG